MLNHQLIKVDNKGFLMCTYEDPLMFAGGTPTKDGLLCIDETDPEVFNSGLGYKNNRRICMKQAPDEPGGPNDASGALRAVFDRLEPRAPPPRFWLQGLPFDKFGRLCLAIPKVSSIPNVKGDFDDPTTHVGESNG